jgi:hypothetical protein
MTNRNRFGRWMLMGLCLVISGCVQATTMPPQAVIMLTPPPVPLASEQADVEAKRFQPQQGKASIYVIREDIFTGQAVLFQVNLDGKDQGKLSRGTYFLFTVPPGKHIVDFAGGDAGRGTETISALEGGIYYLEIRPKSSMMAPPTNIFSIDLHRGRQLILGGKRAEVKPADCLFAEAVYAQAPADVEMLPRIDIGSGFSVSAPKGQGWRTTGAPASYYKLLGPEDHSLVLIATTGPSGISNEEILAVRGPNGGNQLVKLFARLGERNWKAHAAGMQDSRFEPVDVFHDTGKTYSLGNLLCDYSRIVVRDRGALVDEVPTRMRYVAYTCVQFPDMKVAATVSYSERGREQDLSCDAMAEGERFTHSLQRLQRAERPR